MKTFWNERYSETDYVYGEDSNMFFATALKKILPGKLILPCEGEGRNAVFAAKIGWEVNAFDYSETAKNKADKLANKEQVIIKYAIQDVNNVEFADNSADVVAFVYAHFPKETRAKIHQKAVKWLKPGGKILLEAFNPNQINNTSGGPKDASMLYAKQMLEEDFEDLNIEYLEYAVTELTEGKYHEGKADVVRLIASKKQ